jgi:hypothetical protein
MGVQKKAITFANSASAAYVCGTGKENVTLRSYLAAGDIQSSPEIQEIYTLPETRATIIIKLF